MFLPTDAEVGGGNGGHAIAWEAGEQMLFANLIIKQSAPSLLLRNKEIKVQG